MAFVSTGTFALRVATAPCNTKRSAIGWASGAIDSYPPRLPGGRIHRFRRTRLAVVGWPFGRPSGAELLAQPLWREMLSEGQTLVRRQGVFDGVAFRELIATPLG